MSPDYNDPKTWINGVVQWGYNTNVKVIFGEERIVSGVQIINKVEKEDFFENYKLVRLVFSDGFEKLVSLSSNGKQNEITNLEPAVRTSFVNVLGVSTFGHMPKESMLGEANTGFRSGLSEIRIFGCNHGISVNKFQRNHFYVRFQLIKKFRILSCIKLEIYICLFY